MSSRRCATIVAILFAIAGGRSAVAQDEAAVSPDPDESAQQPGAKKEPVANTTAGEFTPGTGFDLFKSELVSLNISAYGLFRYINQLPADQSFTDHLGRRREIDTRNDIQWHRSFVWLSGFFFRPQLRYTISIWSLPSTEQTLVFGNLRYRFSSAFEVAVGIGPNLGSRSMQGPWPFLLSSDRQMADDFFRPGFTSSVWVAGELLPRFHYAVALGNNISQLGVGARRDAREMTLSASVWWQPTTGEFGPRGGFGDFEQHEQVATRFGASATYAPEDRYAPESEAAPGNTQIRLSDGVLLFETGALADMVTVRKADYNELAIDLGVKYQGFHLQTEYYLRRLSSFSATGPLPVESLVDHGFYVQAMHMVWPRTIGLYGTGSFVFDDFERRPWELGGGLSAYPSRTRSWRLNVHIMYVRRSPAGGFFGFYVPGQTGPIVSIGTDILL
jgi:hypothetical protein